MIGVDYNMDNHKVRGLHPGDICRYAFHDCENLSECEVEVLRIFQNGEVAEIRVLRVFNDDSGNGYFSFLARTNEKNTMNASTKYLQKVNS